jgi:hypothetical protein
MINSRKPKQAAVGYCSLVTVLVKCTFCFSEVRLIGGGWSAGGYEHESIFAFDQDKMLYR